MHVCTFTQAHVHTQLCTYIHMYMRAYTHTHLIYIHRHRPTHTNMHRVDIYRNINTLEILYHVHINICDTRSYAYLPTYLPTYVRTYIRVHSYIRTYILTSIDRQSDVDTIHLCICCCRPFYSKVRAPAKALCGKSRSMPQQQARLSASMGPSWAWGLGLKIQGRASRVQGLGQCLSSVGQGELLTTHSGVQKARGWSIGQGSCPEPKPLDNLVFRRKPGC